MSQKVILTLIKIIFIQILRQQLLGWSKSVQNLLMQQGGGKVKDFFENILTLYLSTPLLTGSLNPNIDN